MIAIFLSALAMSVIVALRYLVTSGGFALWTARRFPQRLAGQRAQVRREIGWSLASAVIYGAPAGIVAWGWQQRGWTDLFRRARLSAVVASAQSGRLPAGARHMVLLDPPVDAPPGAVSDRPRSPSRQPPADGVGGNELSPVGSGDGGGGDPAFGVPGPDPCRRTGRGVGNHDGDGGHQSHGVGDVPSGDRSWKGRAMADNGKPS
jgi:hypothetical protein